MVLKADRKLFSHMILVAESRKVSIKDVLTHSLASANGSLRKTNKAVLARELEKNVAPAEIIKAPSACIIDGMSLVQKTNGNNKTFGELAETVLLSALLESKQSNRVDVVFDVYHQVSIKDAERLSRGASSELQYKKIIAGCTIQQWRKFLCSSRNKTSLIKFIVEEWTPTI